MVIKKIPSELGRMVLSSSEIRNRFINFFKSHNHIQIKSSSVQPFADSTLEFVNAGMNQFKNVFLGLTEPPIKRAVNSQKCIRVGGKHNDLDIVGHDSYHHTFFEMLGNWSFSDYFKEEACLYALELITSAPYSLPIERLYFTYFQGDEALNLPPDLETKNIWRKLGVNERRILGFGLKDNFWEMGMSGPCGPCTEIHYDHLGSDSRAHLVNKDLPDLTELWNIVFIQFNRKEDGTLEELSRNYVDTGMGFERLVALLQGSSSNYDSDLFSPLFETIAQNSQLPPYRGRYGKYDESQLDTRYRMLADHSRMIAVSLSDNMLPDYSHSLRRVIRKSLIVADSLSPKAGLPLLLKTVCTATKTLSGHFPQIEINFKKAETILKDEEILFRDVRESTQTEWKRLLKQDKWLESLTDCQSVGLIEAYKYLRRNTESTSKVLDVEQALICYDRYGLNISLIEQLANIKGYTVDRGKFDSAVEKLKKMNKSLLSHTVKTNRLSVDVLNVKQTDDKSKFSYIRDLNIGTYSAQKLHTEVLKAWVDDKALKNNQHILYGSNMSLLLSSTNFHAPVRDCGKALGHIILTGPSGKQAHFTVLETQKVHDWIVHKGFVVSLSDRKEEAVVYDNWSAECSVDMGSLEGLMRNTTVPLLLESYLKTKFSTDMTFLNSQTDNFNAKFYLYGKPFLFEDIIECEAALNNIIQENKDFTALTVSCEDLLSDFRITIPPYLNPSLKWYQLVSSKQSKFSAVSSSPNILNSKDLFEVCLTRFSVGKRNRECVISGLTGPNVKNILSKSASELINALLSTTHKAEVTDLIKSAKNLLSNNQVPLTLQSTLRKVIEDLKKPSKHMKIRR